MALIDKLTAIADAIRGKTGKQNALTLDQMPGEIAGIESGGNSEELKQILDRTITDFNNSEITELGYRALNGCAALTNLSLPNCVKIGESSIQSCVTLENVNLPNLNFIGPRSFMECKKLKTLILPKVKKVPNWFAYVCESLEICDFHMIESIGNVSFDGCKNLKALIIRSSALCVLQGGNAFTNSGIASETGYIYVPASILEEYKAATNWSVYANQFKPIEGSEYE